MRLVEKEITQKNIERANNSPELVNCREREQKFVCSNVAAEYLFRRNATPIEQIYLSAPTDEFSLRVRCHYQPEGIIYTATLKDPGEVIDGARDRLEVTTEISQQAYELYASKPELARIRKLRTEIQDGVTIDFIEGLETPIIEVEHNDPEVRGELVRQLDEALNGRLIEHTGDRSLDNEMLAYELSGIEKPATPESLDTFTERVLYDMVACYALGNKQVVVSLTGMSGSGKSTVTKALQERMSELYGEEFTPIILSTDDYHFGKAKLEELYGAPYTEWDDAKTYNTKGLAHELGMLSEGVPIIKRHFDFESEEPILDGELPLSPFVIIEGLYAGSKDLATVSDLQFEVPTSIATSVGRDVRRLIIENRKNRAFPTAESRLRYQIETAIPLYIRQETSARNVFSASSRYSMERVSMITKLDSEAKNITDRQGY